MAATAEPITKRRRWLGSAGRILRIGLVAYLGIILVLMFLENWMVYPLSTAADSWWDAPNSTWKDMYFEIDGGTRIHAWWCPLPGATEAMLYCHGNGGNLSHRGRTIEGIHKQLGVSVLIFDYPGYGKSGGSPSEAGCYAAAEKCYHWLTENHFSGDRILLFGNSLGGGVATYIGSKYPHRALILSKTFTSLPDVGHWRFPWLPVRWIMRNRFDSASRIKDCTRPVFITHGKLDDTIPFAHGQSLFAAANEPKECLWLEEGDHNAPLDEEFFARLKSFLAKHAQMAPAPAAR